VVVAPGDSTVTITTVVAGTTTTYTLTVSAAVMTLINNATTNIATLFSDITNIDTEITTINNTLAILGTNFRGQHIHTLPAAEAQLAGLNVTPSPAGQYQIFVDSQWDMETNPCIGYLRLTKNGTYIDANDVGIMNVNTNTTPISNSFNNFVSCNGTDVIGIKGIATDAFGMTGTITIKAVLLIPA
jgi:hypothetical protein